MKTIDHLATAANQCLRDGDHYAADYFCRVMDADARLKFDGFLLRMKDPLAYQAGTCENRFVTRVLRMIKLERERRENSEV